MTVENMTTTARQKEHAEMLAIAVSLGLALIKGAAAFWTGTLSLFASALDSFFDAFVSGLNLFTLNVARRRPDQDHMFGHEKAEALAGLFQTLIILVSAGYLIYASLVRLRHPLEVRHLNAGMGVIALSIVASLWLTYRLRQTARETASLVLKTDALHYAMDLYTQGGILVALALIQLSGWRWIDPLLTIPIAFYIGFLGFRVGKEAVDELMDREVSPEPLKVVQEIVSRHSSEVTGLHNFKTRRAGGKRFLQLHVEIKKGLTFERVHAITEIITGEIRQNLGDVEVLIHPDPEGSGSDESDLF